MIDEVRRDGAAVRPGSQSASLSSRDRGWDGIVVEQGRFRPCDGGEVVYNEHVIGLVLGDRVRFGHSVDGRGYEGSYRPGDLVFCPGGRPVRWTVDEPWDGAFVMLRPEVVRQAADEIGLNPSRLDLVGEPRTRDPLVAQIAHALLAVLKESMGGERLYVESLRNALAIHLARSYSTHSQPAARTDRGLPVMKLRRAVEAIHENLEQGVSLGQLAETAGVSVSHFEVLFKRSTGLTPYQYVLRCRVERAKHLLCNEGLSLVQVAALAGFCDQGHLARQFKRIVGVTPSGYRKGS